MFNFFSNFKLKEWLLMILSACLIVGQVFLDLKLPDFMNEISTGLAGGNIAMNDVWINGGYMLACALGSALLAVITGFCVSRVAASFSKRLRSNIFNKVNSFSLNEMKKFSTASLITRSTNDVTQVQMAFVIGLQVLIKAPVMAVWAICKILDKSWQWSAATGVAIAFMLLVIVVILLLTFKRFKKIQKQTDAINGLARENLKGIRVVRAYNAENYQEDKFNKANQDLTKTNMATNGILSILNPSMSLVMNGLTLSVYLIGAILINGAVGYDRVALFGDMVVFTAYAMQVVMSFMMLVMVFIVLPRAIASWQRIKEVINTDVSVKDGQGVTISKTNTGKVEFKNVSFKYPGAEEYVLKNISFTANPGETVAFIGSTGSGKSTLINLVPRFYDATEGEVLIDGVNVKDMTLEQLHNKLGYVPQKAVLFSGTVNSNIAYGDNGEYKPTQEDIKTALKVAQGKDFVERMENKYESTIEQGGANVSGGQKQRLAIARAIARNPEIYIFDDSFSALDYKTDKKLRQELREHTQDSTVLIVGQRIGTIKNANRIIVLDNGEMVGIGTHEELLKKCNVYKEIAYSQLSKEELGDE
ncbi:MAG: ABC transporter ATP-binding protein [Clostridia bacterium]|nr:ABC transporter ATP-binding protein [Clostridia bacterium]